MTAAERIHAPRVLVIAHRGDSLAAPENTLPAFASAVRAGADLVELDYVHTADGVPIVFHDEYLDRVTDACARWGGESIVAGSKTWAELSQLDAGGWFGPQFAGTRIATLAEALAATCPYVPMMIERKSGNAATCVRLLEQTGFIEQVVVTAFDWQYLADCRALAPSLALGALGTKPLTARQLDAAAALGASVIGWDDLYVTPAHIKAAHEHGLRAWVWTVDNPGRAEELISQGIDGLISNAPGRMLEMVRAGMRPRREP